jgi:GTP-binding protein
MLTDEVKIKVHAGKGGDGVVAFNKTKMSLGPTGGKGGNGGNVYFLGVSDLTALNKYKQKRDYYAGGGKNGARDKSTGHDGADIILSVPIGSVLKNLATDENFDITQVGQKVLAAKGGRGGRGNFYFRSSIDTSPQKFEIGKSGEELEFFIELRLIAQIGLIGLPNAGKSSLLNELTKADAKVGNYEFTTLEPNLGSLDGLIIADIPGLIEGASDGKGLGVKFLKHIRRTKTLFHCIDASSRNILKDYRTIRKELEKYHPELGKKSEMILLTKSDLLTEKDLKKEAVALKKSGLSVFPVSIHDWESIESLKNKMQKAA